MNAPSTLASLPVPTSAVYASITLINQFTQFGVTECELLLHDKTSALPDRRVPFQFKDVADKITAQAMQAALDNAVAAIQYEVAHPYVEDVAASINEVVAGILARNPDKAIVVKDALTAAASQVVVVVPAPKPEPTPELTLPIDVAPVDVAPILDGG